VKRSNCRSPDDSLVKVAMPSENQVIQNNVKYC